MEQASRRTGWPDILSVACRLVVGAALIKASIPRLTDHQSLVAIVHAYKILPDSILNPTATLLPWLELALGVLLLLGLLTRTAAILSSVMLGVFVFALAEASVRGLHIDCGCFAHPAGETLIGWLDILLALVLLAGAVYLAWRPDGPLAIDNLIWPTYDEEDEDEDDDGEQEAEHE